MPLKINKNCSAKYLRTIIKYSPESGDFTWRHREDVRPWWNTRYAGKKIAGLHSSGYVVIRFNGARFYGHRLAWLWVTGKWPKKIIDHINRNPSDNRFLNLREATYSQNCHNCTVADGVTGARGVYKNGLAKTYVAKIRVRGKVKILGYFEEVAPAREAYKRAALKYFGQFSEKS